MVKQSFHPASNFKQLIYDDDFLFVPGRKSLTMLQITYSLQKRFVFFFYAIVPGINAIILKVLIDIFLLFMMYIHNVYFKISRGH